MNKHPIQVNVNDIDHLAIVEPRLLLSDFLRKDTGLTGMHLGCEHGVCGACINAALTVIATSTGFTESPGVSSEYRIDLASTLVGRAIRTAFLRASEVQ